MLCARSSHPTAVPRPAGLRSHQGCTMLVLSRKVGEKILIGDKIAVTVVRVAQGIVRIGVEAPKELPIVREEIKDRLNEAPQDRAPAIRP